MKLLVAHPSGPKAALIDIKNNAGRTPLGEAEMAAWDEGAAWLVGVMEIDENNSAPVEATDEAVGDADEGDEPLEIHVEVEDAEGGISKMSIKADGTSEPVTTSSSTATS